MPFSKKRQKKKLTPFLRPVPRYMPWSAGYDNALFTGAPDTFGLAPDTIPPGGYHDLFRFPPMRPPPPRPGAFIGPLLPGAVPPGPAPGPLVARTLGDELREKLQERDNRAQGAHAQGARAQEFLRRPRDLVLRQQSVAGRVEQRPVEIRPQRSASPEQRIVRALPEAGLSVTTYPERHFIRSSLITPRKKEKGKPQLEAEGLLFGKPIEPIFQISPELLPPTQQRAPKVRRYPADRQQLIQPSPMSLKPRTPHQDIFERTYTEKKAIEYSGLRQRRITDQDYETGYYESSTPVAPKPLSPLKPSPPHDTTYLNYAGPVPPLRPALRIDLSGINDLPEAHKFVIDTSHLNEYDWTSNARERNIGITDEMKRWREYYRAEYYKQNIEHYAGSRLRYLYSTLPSGITHKFSGKKIQGIATDVVHDFEPSWRGNVKRPTAYRTYAADVVNKLINTYPPK